MHGLVTLTGSLIADVKGVGVFHDEFASAHQAKARANFVAEFGLDLIEIDRELAIGMDFPPRNIGDNLFMGGAEAVIPVMAALKTEQFRPVFHPAT